MSARIEPQPRDGATSWSALNQAWLTRQLAALRARLDACHSGEGVGSAAPGPAPDAADRGFTPALDRCATLFGLSPFERDLLLLAAGVELDAGLRESVARANARVTDGSRLSQPTFALAFSALAGPHWDALSPQAPLRRWRLVELEGRRSPVLQPLFVDERVLHFLTGVSACDARLLGLAHLEPSPKPSPPSPLSQRIARALGPSDGRAPVVVLGQDRVDPEALRAAAEAALAEARCAGLWLRARDLPADAAEAASTAVLLDREAVLGGAVPVLELEPSADGGGDHEQRCMTLLRHLLGPVLLLGPVDPAHLAWLSHRRVTRFQVPPAPVRAGRLDPLGPSLAEVRPEVARALPSALGQFHLPASAVCAVVERVESERSTGAPQEELDRLVWQACREATRGGLDALAQRVGSRVALEDLVLPPAQAAQLREIPAHLRHRRTVLEEWGMAGKTDRGLGLCVLFVGDSGTGKTLAAEAIANEVGLDLYRIDLATVVSKYIGETEKNLKRLFDAAEASGAVLLFDEADALFGKRSEVKDSHDRYANIEVAYLLQRMEAYRGLAILTTNFRGALDRAFLRRIRFIVQFPFPDEAAREQIWRRELPESVPRREVDYRALARMQLSGGHIHEVALNAAFLAAAAGEPVTMTHLGQAARRELAKMERLPSGASHGAWS